MDKDNFDFKKIILDQTSLIDVRSPVEFSEGFIPGAINLPLIDNQERHLIGLTYKKMGQAQAIELGHQIVSGDLRHQRLQLWISHLKKNPHSLIYCFRGGLRSQTVQKWLAAEGFTRPIISGGYKAFRNYLINVIQEKSKSLNFIVVSGPTGSGKTDFIKSNGKPFVDLEDLAKHRGSAFGALTTPQPTQSQFENLLAFELIKKEDSAEPILIESESRMIGRISLPKALHEKIHSSPKFFLNVDLDTRVDNIFRLYINESTLGVKQDSEKFDEFKKSINAISKKLGGLRTQELLKDLDNSKAQFQSGQGLESNRIWIEKLLVWYYDPLYKKNYIKSEN